MRVCSCTRGRAEQPTDYSKLDDHRKRDERTYLLRSLLFGALTVTGVLYGVAVYWGISSAERRNAGKEFKALAAQVGVDIRKTLAQSSQALYFLAERYATTFPNEADWPLVQLPGFVKDMPYLSDASGFESLLFFPIVKWEDVNRTEQFLMDAWAANPLIPSDAGLLPLPGIYGVNASAGRAFYKDTTKVEWDAQFEVVTPIAQMLMDHGLSAAFLGRDFHATSITGAVIERMMRCTMSSNYSYARENCGGAGRVDYIISSAIYDKTTVSSNIGVPIMLNQNSSQLVGFVGGNFHWGTFISDLIPDQYSGIDMVLKSNGEVITFKLDKGQMKFHSAGDTHGDRFADLQYVVTGEVIRGSDNYTLEFYPQQEFMDERTTQFALVLSVGAGLLILLCTLLFMLYDVPMRKDAVRTEIVLETKRRFVRFVSHEIRTPLNTVNMGLTLFGLELDTIRDAVLQMVGPGQGQGQSGVQPSALEVVQKFLLAKIDELKSIARDVTTSTDEAVVVLNDLLNYDKIESGIFVLEFAFVAVGEVVQRSLAAFLLQARDKNVALTLRTIVEDEAQEGEVGGSSGSSGRGAESSAERMEGGLSGGLELDPRYQLIGDGSRLGQVLRNLLSNAMKFTNAGGTVAVTVQRVRGGMPEQVRIALPEEQSGLLAYPRAGSVRISVLDSGAGLSEQQVQDVGKEGLQFNVSVLQGGGGSGLGLFISKGLVQQHGGKMTVTSPGLGKGVSTTLEFPLFDALDAHDDFPQPHVYIEQQQVGVRASLGPGEGDYLRDNLLQANPGSQKQREQERQQERQQEEEQQEQEQVGVRGSGASADGEEVGLRLGLRSGGGAAVPYPLTIPPAGMHRPCGYGNKSSPRSQHSLVGHSPTALLSHSGSAFGSASASASASPSASASASPGGGRHMLVVDDAVSNRKLLMRIFRLKGFVCEEAYDGQDALQKYANMCAQGTPPAAILMDFEMPVLNGPSATRLLREQGCSCLIIGLTGNVMKADKDFFISCGADDVFAKPLNSEFVLKLIAKIATPRAGAGDRGGTGTGGTGDTGTGGTEDTGTGDTGGGGTSAPTSASASLLTPPSASLLPLALTSAATSTSASAYGFGFSSSKITPSADEPDASAPLRPSLTPTHTTPTPTIAQTHTLSPADMHP